MEHVSDGRFRRSEPGAHWSRHCRNRNRNGQVPFGLGTCFVDRQLQHFHALTWKEVVHAHNLAVAESERIVVHIRSIKIHLAERRNVRSNPLRPEPQPTLGFCFPCERHFCAWSQTHSGRAVMFRCEPASDRAPENCRHESLADLRRPRCNSMQTIVAHTGLLIL